MKLPIVTSVLELFATEIFQFIHHWVRELNRSDKESCFCSLWSKSFFKSLLFCYSYAVSRSEFWTLRFAILRLNTFLNSRPWFSHLLGSIVRHLSRRMVVVVVLLKNVRMKVDAFLFWLFVKRLKHFSFVVRFSNFSPL